MVSVPSTGDLQRAHTHASGKLFAFRWKKTLDADKLLDFLLIAEKK